MSTTNVPALSITKTGVTLPDESDILDGVLADIDASFGGGMNKGLSTPQGQLAQTLTAIVGDKNDQIAAVLSNIDPDVAAGRWQDAIGRIYFLDRIAASGTVVTGVCTGLVGTVIPAGSAVQDVNGYIYYSTVAATIGSTGQVSVQFQNSTMGPIACPIGNLTTIYKAITGWDRVTNVAAGTLGTDVESRADFELRRRASVATNAVNSPQSIQARVLAAPGVVDAYVIDNPTNATVLVGATNFPLLPHSVYVGAAGGAAADIAKAIWGKKSLGCDYNGNTSAQVQDTSYEKPYPTYTVKWQTLVPAATYFNVTISKTPVIPGIEDLIRTAILAAFNGTDGGSRARAGSTIYAGRYYAGVLATSPNVNLESITLGLTPAAAGLTVAYGIDQLPSLDRSNITVTLV